VLVDISPRYTILHHSDPIGRIALKVENDHTRSDEHPVLECFFALAPAGTSSWSPESIGPIGGSFSRGPKARHTLHSMYVAAAADWPFCSGLDCVMTVAGVFKQKN
jgi:hypothetical protein